MKTNRGNKIFKSQSRNLHCSECATLYCSILKDCSPHCLDAISEAKKCLLYEKGDRIISAGVPFDGIYFVSTGKIKIYKANKNGEEVIVRFIKTGEVFDFFSTDETSDHMFSAQAIDDTVICFLENKSLFEIVKDNPDMALALILFNNKKISELQERYYKMAKMHVPAKVADALLTMFETYGSNENGSLNLILSRLEIANLATTTKEQVSKALSEFKDAGIIKTEGKKIEILDLEKLQGIAAV